MNEILSKIGAEATQSIINHLLGKFKSSGKNDTKPSEGEFHIDDIMAMISESANRILKGLEPVNIIVAGQTGVGKSTLLNTIFGENVAEASAGRPVTQEAKWYKSDRMPISILDTKGIEAKDYDETRQKLIDEIEKSRKSTDLRDQIHLAWVCISTSSDRLQDADLEVIKILKQYSIPTIVVMTKYTGEDIFIDKVRNLLIDNNIIVAGLVCVNSISGKFVPQIGITDLVDKSFEILPEGVKAAFAAAQTVSFDLKREAAEKCVTVAVTAAAGIAATPLPFADALALVPIQIGMIYAVSQSFGIKTTKEGMVPIISGIAGSLGMAVAGRVLVSGILKLIPVAGSAAGGAIAATVAGSLTATLGGIYIEFVEDYHKENGKLPDADELKKFGEYYEKNK